MEVFSDLLNAARAFVDSAGGDGKKTRKEATLTLLAAASKMFGLPVANIKRDLMATLRTIAQASGSLGFQYEVEKFSYNLSSSDNRSRFIGILYDALEQSDYATYEHVRRDLMEQMGLDGESIQSSLKTRYNKKAESEDICFIADGDYAGYIERRCGHPAAPGDIVWRDDSVVGRHNGALRYTIGQRKGLGVAMAHPVYVTGVDAANNIVHLGEAEDLTATALTANDWIWSAPADRMEAELDAGGIRVGAKYRYRQKDQAATLTRDEDGQMLLTFDEPQRAIAPGQAVVVYRGDIVLGGGTVTGALK